MPPLNLKYTNKYNTNSNHIGKLNEGLKIFGFEFSDF